MSNTPLLSIVVPTKNRVETLRILVESLLAWKADNFELIVHDNSDEDNHFADEITKYSDDCRLRYFHVREPLSAIENCDLAVHHARGEYVSFIGDDDGVIRQTLDVVAWMKKHSVDALYCRCGTYTWPGMEHAFSINRLLNGVLVDAKIEGLLYKTDARNELKKVLNNGAQQMFNIPRLYQGIVSKESLDKLYAQAKTYFPGPVPDMSNSIGLIPHLRSSCYTDVPFIVSGQSKKSMSGKNSVRAHQGDLRREPSLPASTFDDWTETIPRYWSAPTIWAETAYKAAQRTNQIEILKEFDYHWLYASCFAYSKREYYPLVFAAMFRNKSLVQKVFTLFTCTWLLCRIFLFRVGIFVRKYIFGVQGKKFETIAGALHYLETKLDQENILSRLDRTLVGL